jgi:hypothetical protein
MKEELQGKLVEILTSIQAAAGKASDFAMEQLPDIAQSYVAYGRFVSAFTVAALVLAAVVASLWARYLWRNPSYSTWSWDAGKNVRSEGNWAALTVASVGVAGLSMCAAVAAVNGALVWFAPKVWLLKEIAGMLK